MSKPKLTTGQKYEVLRAYDRGERVASIAKRFGVDPSYPGLLAKRRGLKPRNKSAWMSQAVQS